MSLTTRHSRTFVALAFLTAGSALASDKYVLTISPSKVIRIDDTTGAIIDPNFCDIDALLGLAGGFKETRDAAFTANGELLVTNSTDSVVHRFSADGNTHLGDIFVGGRPRGLTIANGSLWVAEDSNVVQYDLTTYLPITVTPLTAPRDLHVYNGELLVSEWNSLAIQRIEVATGSALGAFGSPPGLNLQMATLASGDLLVAQWGPPGYHRLSPTGAVISTTPVAFGQPEGIAELGNGDLLITTQQGVRLWDPMTLTSSSVYGGPALSVFESPTPSSIGTSYCGPAAANTSGASAELTATGSPVLANNDLTLIGTSLPPFTFGFFLNSRTQDFIASPGGSIGNLCLGGAIGRYNLPSQILNSGPGGTISLGLDLTSTPTPTSVVAILPGETWNFQLWFRDFVGGGQTSNFTQGLEVTF